MSAGKVVLLVFGIIGVLISIGLLVGGGAILWADNTIKDGEGFYTTKTILIEKGSHAIVTGPADIDVDVGQDWVWDLGDLATFKVEGSNNDPSKQLFIGVARESDLDTYLSGVEHDEITDLNIYPYSVDYQNHPGSVVPGAPTSQTFWTSSTSGTGTQSLEWELEPGSHSLVLMNSDGSAGIDISIELGAKVPWLLAVGIGLLVGGAAVLSISILMIYFSARRREAVPPEPSETPEGQIPYPVSIKGELTEPPSAGLWLIKWLLAIPHYFILVFLWVAFVVVCVIAFFAILFTGKYPRSLFDFNVGVLRWSWRVGFYSYQALGTDKYPPFSLEPDPDYPADLEIAYPEKLSRGLVLVKWWLLAIPHYIIIGLFQGGYGGRGGGGMVFILAIIAAVILLFTGKYPGDIFKLVVGINRWSYRVYAYAALMTDKYPPFRLWD